MLGTVLDRGYAAMVEDELCRGRQIGERDRLVDLVRPDAKVERPRRSGKPLDIGAKRRAFAQIVGNDVQHAAEPFDERIGELAFEKGWETIILRPARANGAAQQAVRLACKILDIPRFRLNVVKRDIDLHVKGVGDATALRLYGVGFVSKVAIERRNACEPRVPQAVAINEVEMRVDNRRMHRALWASEFHPFRNNHI